LVGLKMHEKAAVEKRQRLQKLHERNTVRGFARGSRDSTGCC